MLRARMLFLYLFLLIPFVGEATDLKPWFGNEHEFEVRASVLYQNYDSLSTPHTHHLKHTANDEFFNLSALYPFKRYCGEFEATAAHTRHQHYGWDSFRLTGRYQLFDQLLGDRANVAIGFTYINPFSRALHDISSFHNGNIEFEVHLAFGKKYGYPCCKNYKFRWWNVTCIGAAEVGRLWFRENAAFEFNYKNVHQFRGFMNTIWGIGKKNLRPSHFHGYGNIDHQSVDVGMRYSFNMRRWGALSIEYGRRVYAYNFPRNANLVLFEYYFPYGSQPFSNY